MQLLSASLFADFRLSGSSDPAGPSGFTQSSRFHRRLSEMSSRDIGASCSSCQALIFFAVYLICLLVEMPEGAEPTPGWRGVVAESSSGGSKGRIFVLLAGQRLKLSRRYANTQ